MPSSTGVYILLIVILIIVAVVVYYRFLRATPTALNPPNVILQAATSPVVQPDAGVLSDRETRLNIVANDFSCVNDMQCPWGQICSQNVCIPKTCSSDSNCQNGQQCVNKQCQPKKCDNFKDCGRGENCVHINPFDEYDRIGFCIPSADCSNNSDCRAGTPYCVGGKCHQCQLDNDCLIGEVCQNGMCKGACTHDSDCGVSTGPDAKQCIPGVQHCCPISGTYGTACQINSDCGDGAYCSPNKVCTCVPTKGKALGSRCSENRDCETGNCITDRRGNRVCGYSGGNCMSDLNCPSDKPYCVLGQCKVSPVGSSCPNSSKCKVTGEDLYCVDHVCQVNPGDLDSVCTDTSDCRSPLVCTQNSLGISVCSEQKASNQLSNINNNGGYIPPPGQPRRIRR